MLAFCRGNLSPWLNSKLDMSIKKPQVLWAPRVRREYYSGWATSEVWREKKKKRKERGTHKKTGRKARLGLAGTHWGLSWGHSGSAGSSSPIEEGKQILITSSTSHTKGPRNARAGVLAGRTTQALTTNETPPTGAFPPTTACECSFQFGVHIPVYVD